MVLASTISPARSVVEQDRGAVTAVVGLTLLGRPFTVRPLVVVRAAAKDVPAACQQPNVAYAYPRIGGEVADDLIESRTTTVIRDVDTGPRRTHPTKPLSTKNPWRHSPM